MVNQKQCPLCNKPNDCRSNSTTGCWCMDKDFSKDIFKQLSEEQLHQACICEACLKTYTYL